MLRELIEIFLRELPGWMAKLEAAVSEDETNVVFRVAHDIKGSTDVFGASNAAEAAQTLERMGRAGDLRGSDEALGVLKAELVWVRQALQAVTLP